MDRPHKMMRAYCAIVAFYAMLGKIEPIVEAKRSSIHWLMVRLGYLYFIGSFDWYSFSIPFFLASSIHYALQSWLLAWIPSDSSSMHLEQRDNDLAIFDWLRIFEGSIVDTALFLLLLW
jgi:hypothetical protein